MTTDQPVAPVLSPNPGTTTESPPLSARSAGFRLGTLFGPAVFGVTAAGVALPKVAVALHATPAQAAWVLTAHALALGVGTALFGRLADALGVRTTLLVGSLVLLLGTGICVSAPNLGTLVAGRFVLAAGSGAMTSGALTLAASSDPARRAQVLAMFGGTMAVFSATATLMGGMVTEWLTWRLTVVLPVLSLLAVPFCLPLATRPGSRRALDLPGAALLTATVSALLVLIQAPTLSLHAPVVLSLVAIVVVAALGLAAQMRRQPEGFVPRSLAADKTFLLSGAIGIGVYAGLFSAMYAVPQILVRQYGWSVFQIGFALLPGAVIGAVVSRLAGRLTSGNGGNYLLSGSAVASAALIGIAGMNGGGAWVLVSGASLGFAAFAVTQVVTTGLMSVRIPPQRRGGAMGLLNLTFFVGGGMGSGAAGALSKSMELTSALGLVALLPLASGLLALTLSHSRHKTTAQAS